MPSPLFPSTTGGQQKFKFYDPVNTSNAWVVNLNPSTVKRKPGNVRKYVKTVAGNSIIMGGREYPPTEIGLVWNQLDKTQVDGIRQFTALDAVVMIDNNDQGFLGVLVVDALEQIPNMNGNVWAMNCSFLVVAPYNGLGSNINTMTPPALTSSANSSTGGFITHDTTIYTWTTVVTKWGESTVSSALSSTAQPGGGTTTCYLGYTFTAPISSYYRSTRIYWNSTNVSTTATFLAEIPAGLGSSWTIYGPYAAYSLANPPTINTAFTGYWIGAGWQNDT